MTESDVTRAVFRKSSHSDGGEGCVEAARLERRRLVRDSKDQHGPVLSFGAPEWAAFLADVKGGAYDL
jgi:hypothetical protein